MPIHFLAGFLLGTFATLAGLFLWVTMIQPRHDAGSNLTQTDEGV